jgi:SIR2-like domain/Sir2- and TIR-associating SLOG family/MTH538 TIR-like domain (DUF1863)
MSSWNYGYASKPRQVRRTFFCFHYEFDVSRAHVVRNSWVTKEEREDAGFFDASVFESKKRAGEEILKRFLNEALDGTSVTVALIGNQTAFRPWVRYELVRSFQRGNGLLGIYIHNIKNFDQQYAVKGPNPFDHIAYRVLNSRVYWKELSNGTWMDYDKVPSMALNEVAFELNGQYTTPLPVAFLCLIGLPTTVGLDVEEESDLIALAQYEYNNSGTRHRLNTAILDEFKKRASLSTNHKWIARLPVETVWTTNYDTLLEKSFSALDKRVDVKFSTSQLTLKLRNSDVTVYKMHGDVSDPDNAVLTKDDYERYDIERKAFTEVLRTDLTRLCFLFLGFSFTDANIEYILSRLRQMLKGAQRIHYCIMRRPQKPADLKEQQRYERELARFRHRITDLKRFGIQTVAIDEFIEIEPLLRTLVHRAAAKNVFVSGIAHDFGPLGKDRVESLARRIGKELILRGYNLVSGYGLGLGGVGVSPVWRNC